MTLTRAGRPWSPDTEAAGGPASGHVPVEQDRQVPAAAERGDLVRVDVGELDISAEADQGHQTVRERGPQALLRSRMDFLLLLPHGQRIVLEVDGSQHYTRDRGQRPDSAKYAETMAADRDLKLRGYEVFRFGHDELKDATAARVLLEQFLPALFQALQRQRRNRLTPTAPPVRTPLPARARQGRS
ncbi:hypothetical protein [Streptomyces subrutilus]|uniref:hypothetical protein n=1 Tax=Streptomyces subrutilus TaxID=36818 RepID=UPI001AD81909|nr:hypothetical protein [Streptomyces subrutilus]